MSVQKERKIVFLLIFIAFIIMRCNPETYEMIPYMIMIFFCAYRILGVIITKEKLRIKVCKCIEWWIYTSFLYIVMVQDRIDTKTIGVALIVCAGTVLFTIRMLKKYFALDNVVEELGIALFLILIMFYLAIGMVRVSIELFIIFKILTIFIIFSIVKIAEHTTRFGGMVMMCCSYMLLVVMNGLLNSHLLLSSALEGEKNFYISLQNMYTLPNLETLESTKELWENVVNYLLCRIVDAVLISKLVEIFNDNKSC